MDKLKILWSVSRNNAQIGAISIDAEIYYIYFGPGLPKIINADMRPVIVSNVDNWIIAKTKHRYSLRSLQDIIEAYYEGSKSTYSDDDVESLVLRCTNLVIKRLCRSDLLDQINKLYWIESASAASIRDLIEKIRIDFDKFKARLGEDILYNILCRIYKTCNWRQFDGSDSVSALVSRMGRAISEPKYPDLENTTAEIARDVMPLIIGDRTNTNTDIVVKNILVCQQ